MSTPIKITYLVLFIALILMPHFSRHIGPISQAYAESAATIVILGIAYTIYCLHKRGLVRGEQKVHDLERNLEISQSKLVESFEYIGKVNRRLPLLKELSSDLFANSQPTKRYRKTVFENLLATAVVSVAKADWGVLRFVEVRSNRTVKEFVHTVKDYMLKQRISNIDLARVSAETGRSQAVGDLYIVPTSDRVTAVRTYLVLPNIENDSMFNDEYSLLQAITDQAQLFYKYLFI